MKKRFISVLCVTSLILSQIGSVHASKVFETDTLFEAEKTTLNNNMMLYKTDKASGGYTAYSKGDTIGDSKYITVEDLTFLFNVPEDGKYHIHMRADESTSNNTYFYKIDDGQWTYKKESYSWEWKEVVTIELTKGVHKFSYNHALNNIDIDAFYITSKDDVKLPMIEEETGDGDTPETENLPSGKIVHPNDTVYEITGNGALFEAEDVMYTDWYSVASNKQASGGKVLRADKIYGKGSSSDRRGELELTFVAGVDGIYNVWARVYAEKSNQDSYYATCNGGYGYFSIDNLGEFAWQKSATVSLKAGEQTTFRMYGREGGHFVDALIVTPTSFVPTGRTGNFPSGTVKNVLISKSPAPPYNPPTEHPRVLFTANDVEKIRENLYHPNHVAARSMLENLCDEDITGDSTGKYDERLLRKIEALAFDYAINGNKEHGKLAADAIVKYVSSVTISGSTDNITRYGGAVIFRASEVYDWCYELLSTAQKAKIIEKCEEFANGMEMKWPPYGQGALAGHGAEAQLLRDTLAFAIATYNERPDIWETVGGRFFSDYIEARDFFNQGQYALQGDSYGLYRHRWDTWSNLLIKGMGYPSPYNEEDLAKVSYSHVYMRRPDGQTMRDGDSSQDTDYSMWKNWQTNYGQVFALDAALIQDPYLKDAAMYIDTDGAACQDASPIAFLVADDPNLERASVSNLPYSKYFPAPAAGIMVARTGWQDGADSNAVVCEMKVGGVRMNGHQHYDCGHFQIYYKGILASDSGVYQGLQNNSSAGGTHYNSDHRTRYMIKTIAHNSMLIYDPNESTGKGDYADVQDGGQMAINEGKEPWGWEDIRDEYDDWVSAEVEAQEIDPENPVTPEYTYIKGDLKKAYSSKIKEFKRSFMFFNLFDEEVPAALIVFDKVTSSNKSFKKTWLLHGVEQPTVNGTQTLFRRTYQSPVTPSRYNGKMIVDTMLPKADDANIEIIGGEEEGWSIVNGEDITGYKAATVVDEGNTYRMELSPKTEKETDYFLNVIQVSDNDKEYYIQPTMIETDHFYGAKIKDRAVVFSKSGSKVEKDFTIDFPGTVKATICDVKAGEWQVTVNGENKSVVASQDGGVLAFEASGKVSFHYIGAKDKEIKAYELSTSKSTNLMISGQYVACPTEPEIRNGKMMVPVSIIAQWFKLNITKDGEKTVISQGEKSAEFSEADSTLTVGENVWDMAVTPFVKDGELMVAVRDVVEVFGGSVAWKPAYSLASITMPPVDYSIPKEGYAVMASVKADSGEVDGANVCENAIDGNGDTIWAANGIGRYIDVEFDKPTQIDRVDILFNPNGGRTARFDILVSDDGVTFTKVLTSVSDGSLEDIAWEYYELEKPIKTKYVRYMANGSNVSNWNAIKEIRFRKG